MRLLDLSSEAEMIAEFLRQEYASAERYGERIRFCLEAEQVPVERITEADLTNEAHNAQRRRVLTRYRGYGAGVPSYLTDFPAEGVRWQWAILSPDELLGVRYIRYSYWTELSGGSRSPVEAAERIRAGFEAFGESNQGFFDLAAFIVNGGTVPPLILVTADEAYGFVVLEGHTRLTAYALAPQAIPNELKVLIGSSPDIARWDEY